MPTTFRIPKTTDRELLVRLAKICASMQSVRKLHIRVNIPHGESKDITSGTPESSPELKEFFDLGSRVFPSVYLLDAQHGRVALNVERKSAEPFDSARIDDDWFSNIPVPERGKTFAKLSQLTQEQLRVDDINASLSASADSEWGRFRDAQVQILASLEAANERLLVNSQKELEQLKREEHERSEALRSKLEKEHEERRKGLEAAAEKRQAEIDANEEELKSRLAEYETHEARYVARQETKAQLEQLKDWLADSSLTEKTNNMRLPVLGAYVLGLMATGAVTGWFSYQNIEILKTAGTNLGAIPWWQWVALTLKPVLPFAAFVTFLVYLIRWSTAWAKQHADEELRTRARIVDIGRSSWLVEAVRDAAENQLTIPPELIQQLSRNLFAETQTGATEDIHPSALSDLLMQQLSSLRIKTPAGAEVEATRSKGK